MMLMMGAWLIVPLLLIGAVAYALGFRPESIQTQLAGFGKTPLETLKDRYARGEITGEEFEQIRQDLEG